MELLVWSLAVGEVAQVPSLRWLCELLLGRCGHLLTPEKAIMTDKSNYALQIHPGEPICIYGVTYRAMDERVLTGGLVSPLLPLEAVHSIHIALPEIWLLLRVSQR